MTEIPIVVSDDVVTVGGYTDKVELQLSVGATGERGSRIFTGSVNPNTLPSNDPIWGGYTDFKRGDIYLLRDTDLLEVWEYLWSGGEYVWVQTVDNIAGGGGSVTLDPDLDAIAALTGTGILKRTAPNTWALDTTSYLTANQTITLSGDASGSGTTSIVVTVADDSHSHTGSTISGLDAGDTTTGTFDIARIPTGTSGTTVALGNHTHSYQPVDGDLTAIAAVSGTGYLRRTGVDTWTLDTPATATWGGITGTLSSQTDLQSALDGKQSADADLTAIAALAGTSGLLKKTAANTWTLDTATYLTANQTITLSGDASGSGTTAITVTVADDSHAHTSSTISALDAGDTTTGTFDIARIPTGTTGTTVALGNHTHSYQPLDADLTAIAALAGTSGFLKKTATDTWALDTSTYLTGNQTITLSGDATGSGTTAITVTVVDDGHSHTGSTISGLDAGDTTSGTFDIARIPTGTTGTTVSLGNHTHSYLSSSTSSTQAGYFGDIYLYDDSTPSHYLQVTNSANLTAARLLSINVNDADRTISLSGNLTVPSAATVSGTNTGDQTITLTGDVTGSGTGSFATTLAASGVSAGTYNNVATEVRPFTVDAKGRITSIGTAVTIAPAWGSISGKPTTLSGYGITDALSNSTSSTQSGYFGDIYLYDDSTPSHYLQITNSANLTASRLLSINVNDAARTVSLSGDLTVSSTATVSGTNTGDQTITLTGNVTGSGTGSFATTIANDAVTYAKMQNVSAQYRVLGRISASAGDAEELTGENLVTVLGQATSKTGSGSIVFHTAPTFSGTVTATTFSGSGASLTSIPQSAVTNLTTDLSGKQPLDADLTAIAGLAGTSGLLKKTAANTWTLDTSTYLTSNQTITLSGDATGSGTTAITVAVVDDSHSHTGATISGLDAGDTTTGTFDIARIPTGTTGSTVALGNHTHSYLPLSGGTLTGVVWQSAGGIGQYGSGRSIEQRDTLGSGYGWTLSSTSTDWFILGVYDTFGDQPGTLIFNSTSNRWQFTGNIRSADNIMINGSSKLLIGTETGGFKGEIRSQSNYPIVFMPYNESGTALSSAEFFYKTDSSRWQTESNFRVDGTLWAGGATTLDSTLSMSAPITLSNNSIKIGTGSYATDGALHAVEDGNVILYLGSSGPHIPRIRGIRPGGTWASKSATAASTNLLEIAGIGYGTSAAVSAAGIRLMTGAGTISDTSMPGRISFYATPDGSTTWTERMRIDQAGIVSIITATSGLAIGDGGPRIMTGTTSPEGSVTAPVGSEVINTSDGSKYDKISGTGNTGWALRVNGAGYVEDTQVMMMMGVL